MSLQGWHELACECGGKEFVPVFRIIWQSAQGSANKPYGYRCLGCNNMVDQAKMIVRAKQAEAQEKIKELESSLG